MAAEDDVEDGLLYELSLNLNPVTGDEHSARVILPHGFEYREAEYASGSARASGLIDLDFSDRHAHLAMLDMSPTGVR